MLPSRASSHGTISTSSAFSSSFIAASSARHFDLRRVHAGALLHRLAGDLPPTLGLFRRILALQFHHAVESSRRAQSPPRQVRCFSATIHLDGYPPWAAPDRASRVFGLRCRAVSQSRAAEPRRPLSNRSPPDSAPGRRPVLPRRRFPGRSTRRGAMVDASAAFRYAMFSTIPRSSAKNRCIVSPLSRQASFAARHTHSPLASRLQTV